MRFGRSETACAAGARNRALANVLQHKPTPCPKPHFGSPCGRIFLVDDDRIVCRLQPRQDCTHGNPANRTHDNAGNVANALPMLSRAGGSRRVRQWRAWLARPNGAPLGSGGAWIANPAVDAGTDLFRLNIRIMSDLPSAAHRQTRPRAPEKRNNTIGYLARPERLELPTPRFVVWGARPCRNSVQPWMTFG